MASDDADVVQHGRLLHKLAVHLQFGMSITDAQGFIGHPPAVNHQNRLQLAFAFAVEIIYNLLIHFVVNPLVQLIYHLSFII